MMALSRFLPFFKPNTQVTPSNENNPVTSNQIIADLPTIEYSKKSLLARKLVALESLQAILLVSKIWLQILVLYCTSIQCRKSYM